MNKPLLWSLAIPLGVCPVATSLAQSTAGGLLPPPLLNRVRFSARLGFNVKASFDHIGGFPVQTDIGPATGGGIDRFYDDGFNRVDASGNSGNHTWFWGYQTPSQVDTPNDVLDLHSSQAAADGSTQGISSDPQLGGEITYSRQLFWNGIYRWSVEGGFGYNNLTFRDRQDIAGDVVQTTDAYALGGITPPSPPYAGTYAGPGPIIGDVPARSTTTLPGAALTTGHRDIEAQLYTFRLGPFLESAFSRHLFLGAGGGISLALVDSQFSFHENVSIPGAGTILNSGSNSKNDFLWGWYVEGKVSYEFNERWSAFMGVQYHHLLDSFQQTAGNEQATLGFGHAVFLSAGVGYSF